MENTFNPRLIEIENTQIAPTSSQVSQSPDVEFRVDRDWVKQAFMLADSELEEDSDIKNRYWSSATAKFVDTRLGGNLGINARPQYNWYSDIRSPGRLAGRTQQASVTHTAGNLGMGRQYSEYLDDPAQVIYMRFGDPQMNSLTNFLSRAFDSEQASIARTGRAPSIFYTLGKVAGTAIPVIAFPAISITILAGKVISAFFGRSTSKFYTIKPAMHKYWSMVSLLTNTYMVNRGIMPKILETEAAQKQGKPFALDPDYLKELHNLLPEMFTSDNYVDVYAIANRAQRLANQLFQEDFDALNQSTATDYAGYVKKTLTGDGSHPTYISDKNNNVSFFTMINRLVNFKALQMDQAESRMELDPRIDPNSPKADVKGGATVWYNQFLENIDAEIRDGSQFAAFRVDHTGPVTESWSSAVVESDLSTKLNGISSQFRQARFSFADGNIAGGLVGLAQDAIGAVADVAAGTLDGATFGFSNVLMGLAGNGYMDIPKTWQSSSVQLPQQSYSMQLISPYGNVFSQMQNIYLPLFMILAAAMPQSTGAQSYTSPLLCQVFDRGRYQSRLAMVTGLSVTRGTSNLAFDYAGNALAIDVTFQITDLSSIMHMPVSSGSLTSVDMTLDEDNILADYLAVLAGQDIYSQTYSVPKAKLKFAKFEMGLNKYTSPAWLASGVIDSSTSGLMKYITGPVIGSLNAAVAGTSVFNRGGVQ